VPGGPVGSVSRWAVTSNVKVDQTTYPVNRGRVGMDVRERNEGQITKRKRGSEGVEQGRGPRGPIRAVLK